MLVIAVIGMASLIGFAMLSNASLQAMAAGNHERAATADYLAESAVQTATYYLQRDLAGMPGTWDDQAGHTIYAQNVTVSGVDGSFDIDVTPTTVSDVYQTIATGRSSSSTPITRTIIARVKVIRTTPQFSAGFGSALVLPLGITFNGGPVVTSGVSGLGILNLLMGWRAPTSSDYRVPTVGSGELNYYGGDNAGTYTTPTGEVGTAQILSTGTISSPATLAALPTNPGKVFYSANPVFITGAGTYSGTLISRGKIEVKTPLGSTVNWNRMAGFPAMITDTNLHINSRSLTMNINGVVYAGQGVTWALGALVSGTTVRINGALIAPSGTVLGAPGLGGMQVNYTPANNDIQNMTNLAQPVIAVKYLSWDQ